MSDIVRPVPTGPLDPFGGRGGREVEHVAKDRSGNLGCQLQERSPSLGAAFDAKRAETNTQVIRMLMTSRLASGKQPFGRVELSADPDLTAPWEIEQKNTEGEGCIYSVTPSELLICAAAIRSCSDHLIDKRSDLTATLETLRLWLRLREQA